MYDVVQINKERAGVLLGSGFGGISLLSNTLDSFIESGFRKIPSCLPPYIVNKAPALLAIDLGFMGPNYSIAAACATSNYCLCAAANHIREGEADLMIAGGVEDSFNNFCVAALAATTALSKRNDDPLTASRPWDKDRDGFVIGEGAGVLVIFITRVGLVLNKDEAFMIIKFCTSYSCFYLTIYAVFL